MAWCGNIGLIVVGIKTKMPYDAQSGESERRQKIVVLGEQGAGKTSILCRFIYDEFEEP